ncbi:TetR/AcrR family transcriptional regulator [Photobacterium swingsii]|uniref:TetR/AcrR family transcriptional regulator n=1 Tax=Photobacterium swingsii TaxID=680026 RepID=UPI003D0A843D
MMMSKNSKGRPAQISNTEIIKCALKIGLDQVSMHMLGKQLGVSATALYRHVSSKDDLILQCCDFVMGKVEIPNETEWEPYLYCFAKNFRKVLLSIPGSVEFIRYIQEFTPNSCILVDDMLGVFRKEEFDAQVAFMAFATVFTRVTDIVQHQERAGKIQESKVPSHIEHIDDNNLPNLSWLLKQTKPVDYDQYFADGITISVEGLKAFFVSPSTHECD